MDPPEDRSDQQALRGRCSFCAGELPADATLCPECGHAVAAGFEARPRRPVWVQILAYAFLVLVAAALVAWAIHMVGLR